MQNCGEAAAIILSFTARVAHLYVLYRSVHQRPLGPWCESERAKVLCDLCELTHQSTAKMATTAQPSKTFYKRPLPSPPAIGFSTPAGRALFQVR